MLSTSNSVFHNKVDGGIEGKKIGRHSERLPQRSRYVGAMATKTNSTQVLKIDISSIKSLPYMSFHGVVVSTSASHSENRGSIPCQGIFPFFSIF